MTTSEILSMVFGESAERGLDLGDKIAVIDGRYAVVNGRERLVQVLAAAGVVAVRLLPHRETKAGLVPPSVTVELAAGTHTCTVWCADDAAPSVARLGKESGVPYPVQVALAAALSEALAAPLAAASKDFLVASGGKATADVLRANAATRRSSRDETGGETAIPAAPAAAPRDI